MPYDRAEKYKEALKSIEEHNLYFISDVIAWLGITEPTFYDWWKVGSKELKAIKSALNDNKIKAKVSLRKKWKDGENPTLQLALYKIIGSEEEAHRLNGSKQELNATNTNINVTPTKEEAKEISDSLEEEV